MTKDIFKNKKANFQKLLDFGFQKRDPNYVFSTQILDGEFELDVIVSSFGEVTTKVFDSKTQEEYVLHKLAENVGGFVAEVKNAVESVLQSVCLQCFERDVFQSRQAKALLNFVDKNFGEQLEFLWEKFDEDAIWRRKDNRKWYGLIIVLSKNKLGLASDERVDMLVFRIDPNQKDQIVNGKTIFEGYHMNKKSWATVCLDDTISDEELFSLLTKSRQLALKK